MYTSMSRDTSTSKMTGYGRTTAIRFPAGAEIRGCIQK